MRARYPDAEGFVDRDGLRIGYEVFGDGEPTILLMPTWTIIHSRFWKMQVPYLSRRHRVITYDGPGNGRSDRSTDPERYRAEEYAKDAAAVLDACGVDRVVLVGLSLGAQYGARFAWMFPERAAGLVMIGPSWTWASVCRNDRLSSKGSTSLQAKIHMGGRSTTFPTGTPTTPISPSSSSPSVSPSPTPPSLGRMRWVGHRRRVPRSSKPRPGPRSQSRRTGRCWPG